MNGRERRGRGKDHLVTAWGTPEGTREGDGDQLEAGLCRVRSGKGRRAGC